MNDHWILKSWVETRSFEEYSLFLKLSPRMKMHFFVSQTAAIIAWWWVLNKVTSDSFWGPTDCSFPGSSVHGIFQARIWEWVAISSFRGTSWTRDQTCISWISYIGRWILHHYTTWEAHSMGIYTDKYLKITTLASLKVIYMCNLSWQWVAIVLSEGRKGEVLSVKFKS